MDMKIEGEKIEDRKILDVKYTHKGNGVPGELWEILGVLWLKESI